MCVCVCVCVFVCVCVCVYYTAEYIYKYIYIYHLPPFSTVSILSVIILSIRSEEVMSFLVLLIHINTHNRMEINL